MAPLLCRMDRHEGEQRASEKSLEERGHPGDEWTSRRNRNNLSSRPREHSQASLNLTPPAGRLPLYILPLPHLTIAVMPGTSTVTTSGGRRPASRAGSVPRETSCVDVVSPLPRKKWCCRDMALGSLRRRMTAHAAILALHVLGPTHQYHTSQCRLCQVGWAGRNKARRPLSAPLLHQERVLSPGTLNCSAGPLMFPSTSPPDEAVNSIRTKKASLASAAWASLNSSSSNPQHVGSSL